MATLTFVWPIRVGGLPWPSWLSCHRVQTHGRRFRPHLPVEMLIEPDGSILKCRTVLRVVRSVWSFVSVLGGPSMQLNPFDDDGGSFSSWSITKNNTVFGQLYYRSRRLESSFWASRPRRMPALHRRTLARYPGEKPPRHADPRRFVMFTPMSYEGLR